jgi:hypothetical protein
MPDFATNTTHHASTAAADSCMSMIVSSCNLRHCSHLRLPLCGQYPRILELSSVTPDRGLLFPHEGDI